jgi:mannose-6-phosphate isomerase
MEGIHIEPGFEAKTQPLSLSVGPNRCTFVLACQYFGLERLDLTAPYQIDCSGERFYVLSQIEGQSSISCQGHRETLRPGNSCLLPAALPEVTITPQGSAALLKAYLPDLARNVVEPLRAAGFSGSEIAALGGRTALNPLNKLV